MFAFGVGKGIPDTQVRELRDTHERSAGRLMEEWWVTAVRVSDDALDLGDDLVMRWRGKPFTGISVEEGGPAPRSEVSYVDGIQEGESRDWHPNGALSVSAFYRSGVLHGVMTRYSPNGEMVEMSSFDNGRRISGGGSDRKLG